MKLMHMYRSTQLFCLRVILSRTRVLDVTPGMPTGVGVVKNGKNKGSTQRKLTPRV